MHKLSIIVPCYNCADTLEEAVDSIYVQKVSMPFDVTMVDDGSTDATYAVMQKLATRYPNIRLLRHERNQGGGATRNTAVKESDGDVMFCLDSDDVLDSNSLERITQYWLEKRCDGVGVSRAIKFNGRDLSSISYINNFDYMGDRVPFESYLHDPANCSLNNVFLITRDAFSRYGGYPTEHGFDTQGMAFRFLANGLSAYVCPESVYYNRINYHESYYLREANAGRTNKNWLLILDEFLYLFSDAVKHRLLEHDLTDSNPLPLVDVVRNKADIYARNYRELVTLGRANAIVTFHDANDRYLQYCVGSFHLSGGDYKKALHHFSRALDLGFDYVSIYSKVLEASLKLSGNSSNMIQELQALKAYTIPIPVKTSRFQRVKKGIVKNAWLGPLAHVYIHLRDDLRQKLAVIYRKYSRNS